MDFEIKLGTEKGTDDSIIRLGKKYRNTRILGFEVDNSGKKTRIPTVFLLCIVYNYQRDTITFVEDIPLEGIVCRTYRDKVGVKTLKDKNDTTFRSIQKFLNQVRVDPKSK